LRFAAAVIAAGVLTVGSAAAVSSRPPNPQSCLACFRASDPVVCHQIAVGLAMSREWDRAIAIEERVHAARPLDPEVATALAKMHHDGIRNSPRAIALYHAALHASSGYPAALLGLGGIMQESGRMDIAARYFARAARENPAEPLYSMHLADVLVRSGREAEAEPILKEIVRRWPDTPEAESARTLLPRIALAKP
jgi:tetratricopeptide (TPR) repeat protein